MLVKIQGLGETARHGNRLKPDLTIGTNEVPADISITADPPYNFSQKRLDQFKTNVKKLYALDQSWKNHLHNVEIYQLMWFQEESRLNGKNIYVSISSAFPATVLAFNKGAKEIVFCGVDFVHHPTLKQPNFLKRIVKDFKMLNAKMNEKGVRMFVIHKSSILGEFLPVYP